MAYLNPNEQATEKFLRQLRDEEARRLYLLRAARGNVYTPDLIAASFPAPRTAMDLIGSGMQSDQIRSLERMGQAVTPMPPLQSDSVEVIQQSAPATSPVAVRPPSPAVQSRQMAGPPQQAQEPAKPPTNKNSFDFGISAVPQPSAPAQGLLDTEEPTDSTSWYDDPTRMGLLQAGLGLMSAPRYSTNPNDVTLGSALARGLGGYIQGYGGTRQRLSKAERQRIEDERDARKEEYDIMYLRALTTDAISRANSMNATMTEKAEARRLAGQLKESQVRQILGNQTDLNQTQRVERRKQLMGMSPEMLQSEYHQFFPTAEMQETQNLREKLATYTGEPAESYAAYESKDLISAISKFEEPKKPVSAPNLDDGEMYRRLEQGRRDSAFVETPEYAEAYGRYKNKALRPSLSQSGTATYIPRSDYPAPEGMEAQTTTSALSKVTQTPGGTQINQMNPDDSKEVRDLFSSIQKLEEFENIVQNIDLNNMDRITSDSPEVAKLGTIYTDLLMRLKEKPYNLGVITGPDMDLMESILDNPAKADPTNIRAFFRDKDFYLAKINQLRGILINDAQNILTDYQGSVEQAYEQKFQRPLTWVPKTPPKTSRTSPKTKEILNQVEQPPAVAPVPNNGNESSLIDFLPDPIQNIFR
jgi:hypothetical protein